MADTGWLLPAYQTIQSIANVEGAPWLRTNKLADPINYAADSWASNGIQYSTKTSQLSWDWVAGSGLYPSNANVVGIELNVWGYYYQHVTSDPDYDCNIIELALGNITLVSEPAGNPATQLRRIPDSLSFPVRDDLLDVESKLEFGGPTELFGLPPNTNVGAFLDQSSWTGSQGNLHASLRVGMATDLIQREVGIYISHAQMRIHFEVPATNIDLGSAPEAALSMVVDPINVIRRLGALVLTDVIIEQAQLGNIAVMRSSPEVSIGLPADLTNGTGFIDSTALPTIVITLSDVDLALLRYKDLQSTPTVEVSVNVRTAGIRRDLASSPNVSISVGHNLKSVVGNDAEPTITVSLDANLSADTDMASGPTFYVSTTAYLQGDINLGSECGEAELTTVVSLLANLGYTKGLYSNPNVYVTLNGDGLVAGAALEFSPLVSVTIPFANLGSKFAEPAPDHRTVFKCPVDRTIRITRKDKTIL